MGRKLAFCRQSALQSAMENFWINGYENTSMRDLAGKLGLHLGSVYNALGDKEQVFEAALDLHIDTHLMPSLQKLSAAENPAGALRDLLHDVQNEYTATPPAPGCFFMNSMPEITRINPRVTQKMNDCMAATQKAIAHLLTRAQQNGSICASHPVDATARYLMGIIISLRSLGKMGAAPHYLEDVRNGALRSLGLANG